MTKKLSESELIQAVFDSLEAERTHDIEGGLKLMSPDFRKTSVLVANEVLFPTIKGDDVREALGRAYKVEGREFHIINSAAHESTQTVFMELIEIEPRQGGVVTWPYVLICTFEDGQIARTRHYGDPSLLKRQLRLDNLKDLYK